MLIINAQLADGTGAPLVNGALRIRGNRIMSVGKLSPAAGERVIDARGLILAPSFIDVHNHSLEGLDSDPLAETQIAQGITTAAQGPDGESPWPIKDWIATRKQHPAALNLAIFAGHATIRSQVMGKDFKRVATPAEMEKMVKLTWQAMNEGAIGLSSGLEYEVGSYSNTAELTALARSAAEHGGIYSTHIRDEADKAFDALLEEIEIDGQAHIPVDHSHIGCSLPPPGFLLIDVFAGNAPIWAEAVHPSVLPLGIPGAPHARAECLGYAWVDSFCPNDISSLEVFNAMPLAS